MSIDLNKISPAPWIHDLASNDVQTPTGECVKSTVIICGEHDREFHESSTASSVDLAFAALARNAFDIMMRRDWEVHKIRGKWGVPFSMHQGEFRQWLRSDPLALSADPFTALVEADAWYKANVEHED